MKRHRWQNGDRCLDCGLNREGAGAGPYGAMRYYTDDGTTYSYKAGACQPAPQESEFPMNRHGGFSR